MIYRKLRLPTPTTLLKLVHIFNGLTVYIGVRRTQCNFQAYSEAEFGRTLRMALGGAILATRQDVVVALVRT
jgi:hypothetical protein